MRSTNVGCYDGAIVGSGSKRELKLWLSVSINSYSKCVLRLCSVSSIIFHDCRNHPWQIHCCDFTFTIPRARYRQTCQHCYCDYMAYKWACYLRINSHFKQQLLKFCSYSDIGIFCSNCGIFSYLQTCPSSSKSNTEPPSDSYTLALPDPNLTNTRSFSSC